MSAALRRLDPWPLLRGAPIALPQLLAVIALLTLSAAEGGFPLEQWAPMGVLVALLLAMAMITLPIRGRRARGSITPIVLILGFAVWTAVSITWADDRGAAAIASTRTALLATTFILFARWRNRPRTALFVLTALLVGLGVIAWGVLIQLRVADNLDPWFLYDRLLEPIGYVNAGSTFFGMTAFLGVAVLGGPLPTAHRLLGAFIAVPAAALSLLCLSRGGLLATVVVVILILALLPGRARNGAALGIAGIGLLVAMSALLDVGPAVSGNLDGVGTLDRALDRVLVGTALAVLATFFWASLERVIPRDDVKRRVAARVGAGLIGLLAVVAVGCAVAEVGPVTVTKIRDEARTITRPYSESVASDSRLTAGLNSGRWDFWTVAWAQFEKAPVIGAGADNYRQDYLLKGRSPENPRYPHSLWARSLGQLGMVGTLLLLGWVLAVAVSIRRLSSGTDPAGRVVAVGAAGAFGLWVVHGSADWLLEYGGLSAIVAAIAGLAVSAGLPTRDRRSEAAEATVAPDASGDVRPLEPESEDPSAPAPWGADSQPRQRVSRPSALAPAAAILLVLVAAWSATQWVADRDRAAAASLALDQPQRALDRAERALALDPFGEQADSLLGALAIERGDLAAARSAYELAYARNPRATRPRLWLGVLASADGDPKNARRWLRRALRTAPRDAIVAELSAQVADKMVLDPAKVQRSLADRTAQLVRDPDPAAPTSPPSAAVTAPAAAG